MTIKKKKLADTYINAAEMAKMANIDRSTLTRMHGRGDIDECKVWASKPQPHRLYSKAEAAAVIRKVQENRRGKAPTGVVMLDSIDDAVTT